MRGLRKYHPVMRHFRRCGSSALFASLWLTSALCAGCGERPENGAERPNVLVIIVDDLANHAVGALGGDPRITPNLDRLAAQSAVFENAVVATPLCTPSRAAFLTSRWPHVIGVTQLHSKLPIGSATLGTLFERAGYATAAIGKMHWYRDRLGGETFGFERILDRREWESGLDAQERAIWLARKASWGRRGNSFDARFNVAGEPLAIAPEHQLASFIVDQTLRFIDESAGRPFLAIASFYEPHAPFAFPARFASRVRPEDVALPHFDVEAERESVPGLASHFANPEAIYGPLSEDRIRGMTASYLRSVAWVDDRIGALLAGLEARGLAEDTVVVFWSDHGFLLGEHGLTAKSLPFHEALRSPLMLRAPGWKPRREARLVQSVDVLPTLCELAAIDPPRSIAGRPLDSAVPREFAFSEQIGSWAAVRTERWKLVLGASRARAFDQLYDLAADPDENDNRIADPANASIVADLTARMHAVFAENPPDWMPAGEWMLQTDPDSAVRWAIAQIEPQGRPEPVRRRRAAQAAADDEE